MRRFSVLLFVLLAVLAPRAYASLGDYGFAYGTGSLISPPSTNRLWAGDYGTYYYGYSTSFRIGFDFVFDGRTYDEMSVSSSGVLGLGSTTVTSSTWNYLPGESMPILAPLWDEHRVSGPRGGQISPYVEYGISGDAPNRILVVTYHEVELMAWAWRYGGGFPINYGTWQVRLYEGSGKIEFYYDDLNVVSWDWGWEMYVNTSASIGIANGNGEYISVTPYGSWADWRREWTDDWVDLYYNPIDDGTLYTFQPCNINPTVNTDVGGSTDQVLLGEAEVKNWDTQDFNPLIIQNTIASCANSRYYQMWIDGPNASDYQILDPEGWIEWGSAVAPTIRFTPTSLGVREATLWVVDDNNFLRSYSLAGISIPRIAWVPDLNEGGTPTLADGDTLMTNIFVPRPASRDLTPITLQNTNSNPEAPAAQITIEIDSAEAVSQQYELLTPSSVGLLPGESYTPVIRFHTYGVGVQEAHLEITADGETREFTLRATSSAPAILITDADGNIVDASNPLFQWTDDCVGEGVNTTPITIRNIGTMPLTVSDLSFWLTDTTDRQGTPLFPLERDEFGRAVPSSDYAFSDIPGIAPISANAPVSLPFTLQPGQSRRIYATFVPALPGKRYARAFVLTNAQNVYGIDTTGGSEPTVVMGLATADLVGRGIGAALAADASGSKLTPVVFPAVKVGDWTEMSFTISNTGICDMRILREQLRIFSGDTREFTLMSVLPNTPVDANRNYVLAPGAVDSITVRFKPSRAGTRLATMKIPTNDSTITMPGLAERGAFYLDMTGRGKAGLDGRDIVLSPSLIGGFSDGIATFENTLTGVVDVASVEFFGGDAAEFTEGPNRPWKPRPFSVPAGEKLELGVRMNPVGAPGMRRTELIVVSTTGDTARVAISGEAGTQEIVVGPASLFDNVMIGVGESARRTATITNNGTMPLRLQSVQITGPDASNYRLGVMPRMDILGGATEFVEITFAPSNQGQSTAQLEVTFAGVTRTVQLGGTGLIVRGGGQEDPSTGANGRDGSPELTPESPSGVTGQTGVGSTLSISPNPATSNLNLGFPMVAAGSVTIQVFNAAGLLVRTMNLTMETGAGAARLDVSQLPAGVYSLRVSTGDAVRFGNFTIVR